MLKEIQKEHEETCVQLARANVEVEKLRKRQSSLQDKIDRICTGTEIESDRLTSLDFKLLSALNRLAAARNEAEGIYRRYRFSKDPYKCGMAAAANCIIFELLDEEIEKNGDSDA